MTEVASSAPTELPAVEDQNTYNGPRHDGEYDRLRTQHDMIKVAMGGKLVLAPIDFARPDLRILDSATADGYWLVDLASSVAETATLIGTDLDPQRFITDLPKNISLSTHSIFDTWPAPFQSSFDLVHQRFVLPICSDEASIDAVKKIFACVKQGGYIQLHDGDMEEIAQGPQHEAMMRFRDMMQKAWTMLGYNLSPGPKLAGWLKDAGAVDIEQTVLVNKCGPAAEDKVQGERGTFVMLALLDGIEVLAGNIPGFFFSPEDFKILRADLAEELATVGNYWRTHVVWARKPL
ncbi:MAG: hypothetical protein M1830_004694 [Pleopsidium flavum]|nr:MAG: hypothetical protein M1830_004694 [Pleopsidium flavum]